MIGLARRLLAALLPQDVRAAMLADLDAEYRAAVRPSRGALRAAAWYWGQVAGSIRPAMAMHRRRRAHSRVPRPTLAVRWIADAAQDTRFGLRLLTRHKAFTAAAVATLMLGIGSTTAMFSVVDGVLLRPLPYQDPDGLLRIWSANPRGIARNQISPADFYDWRDGVRGTATLAGFSMFDVTLTSGGDPVRVAGADATANLAGVLGAAPLVGRWFVDAETQGPGDAVVVISEALWRARFGADPGIIGRTIDIDGRSRAITGVMSHAFQFPSAEVRLWTPLPDSSRTGPRSGRYLGAIARLPAGATVDTARDALIASARQLAATYPDADRGWGVTVLPLTDAIVGDVRTPLLVLLTAVAAVLLIACLNVTSLLAARGLARGRELAVRAAVGATTGRLLRMQLVEAMLLALTGGALGATLAAWLLQLVQRTGGLQVPMLDRIALDGRAIAATFGISLICAAVTGLWPAWKASRRRDAEILAPGTRATPGHARVRQLIVLTQIAAATILVVAGGLLINSFLRLRSVPPGFRADRTVLADVALPAARYAAAVRAPFFDRLLQQVRALPGIESAGAGGPLPLSGLDGLLRFAVTIEGRPVTDDRLQRAYLRWATPGYLDAMGIELGSGRLFAASDTNRSTPVIVVDQELVRRYFPGENPIGRRISTPIDRKTWREIIGVVGSVRQSALDREPEPHLYLPEAQVPSSELTLVVRTAGDPSDLVPAIRRAVREIDDSLPLSNVRPLASLVTAATAPRRINAMLLSLFAAMALLLTLVGVYGVIAEMVGQSTREIGVRVALGATRDEVMSLMMRRALVVAAAGVIAGSAAAWAAAPALRAMLYGVGPRDPWTFAAAAILLTAATAAAAWLPARRILRLDVVNALRT